MAETHQHESNKRYKQITSVEGLETHRRIYIMEKHSVDVMETHSKIDMWRNMV